ncbi:MAG: HAD-IA family hydrolase [Bdellovibrionales bacterium]|nr:HAD-IA family hydrolase [Bdellovibrionales bacterium]
MRQHWVFDFDGTLVNTEGFFGKTIGYALQPFGVSIGPNFIEEIRHKHPNQIFDHLLKPNEAKEALDRLAYMGRQVADETPMFTGMEDVLKTLANKGHRISIWTGRDRASTVYILEKRGVKKYFDRIVSGTCVPKNKPEIDGLMELSRHFDVKAQSLAMVGDHHHDIEPARGLGCLSVHARWKKNPHLLPGNIEADHSFDSVPKFHDWIKTHT